MVFMPPQPVGYGVVPFLPTSFCQTSEVDAAVMLECIAYPPAQASMEPAWEAPQNVHHEAWNYDAAAWTTGVATVLDTEGQAVEQWSEDMPAEEQIDDVDAWGMTSKSTLRRRRRQRAADRVASEVSGEKDAKPMDEQPLEILVQIRAGVEGQRSAVARFRRLTFASQNSCRVAQLVLEEASPAEAVVLLKALHGMVREAVKSMFANYVLQRAVEVLPNESTNFIAQELLGVGREVARHRFGCRILCRLLEHGSLEETSKRALLEEVLADTDALSRDAYGNFVIRHCLEFGNPWHQHLIANGLCTNVIETARDQNGSHVIESAMQFCETMDKRAIADRFLADLEQLQPLATDSYGRHAVKALLRTPGEWQEPVAAALRPNIRALKQSSQGRPVLQALQAFESKQF
jgi:hypothetical protein